MMNSPEICNMTRLIKIFLDCILFQSCVYNTISFKHYLCTKYIIHPSDWLAAQSLPLPRLQQSTSSDLTSSISNPGFAWKRECNLFNDWGFRADIWTILVVGNAYSFMYLKSPPTDEIFLQCGHLAKALLSVLNYKKNIAVRHILMITLFLWYQIIFDYKNQLSLKYDELQ